MDAVLGREVLDYITDHPEQLDPQVFGEVREGVTVADLAGHAMLLRGYTLQEGPRGYVFRRPDGTQVADCCDEAWKLLNLTGEEYYGSTGERLPLFGVMFNDQAIERFQAIVEAAEAVEAVSVHG